MTPNYSRLRILAAHNYAGGPYSAALKQALADAGLPVRKPWHVPGLCEREQYVRALTPAQGERR